MKILHTAAYALALWGCAAHASSGEDPSRATAVDAAARISNWSAGYCKGLADANGTDFVTCFKAVTDRAIEMLQAKTSNTLLPDYVKIDDSAALK